MELVGQYNSMAVKYVTMKRQPLPYDGTDCGGDPAVDKDHGGFNMFTKLELSKVQNTLNFE